MGVADPSSASWDPRRPKFGCTEVYKLPAAQSPVLEEVTGMLSKMRDSKRESLFNVEKMDIASPYLSTFWFLYFKLSYQYIPKAKNLNFLHPLLPFIFHIQSASHILPVFTGPVCFTWVCTFLHTHMLTINAHTLTHIYTHTGLYIFTSSHIITTLTSAL